MVDQKPIRLENESLSRSAEVLPLYSHSVPEISMVLSGSGIHRVLDQEIPCSAGDIYIVNADVVHGYEPSEEGLVLRRLLFDPKEWLDEKYALSYEPCYCHGVFGDNAAVAYAMLTTVTRKEIERLDTAIGREMAEHRHEWKEAVRADLALMLITVGRYITDAIKNIPNVQPREWILVNSALRMVNDGFTDRELTLEAIANTLFVSESYLSRLFKRLIGESFSGYLRNLRISHACRLLAATDQTVEEIVAGCGLRDVPSFYRVFHETTGTTPSQYRQQTKKEKGELKMQIIQEISENLQKGKAKIVKELVANAIEAGANVEEILNGGLLHGMNIIGEKFKNNEVYVPEVLVAARAMNMGMQVLKPHLLAQGVQASGKVCIGTVQGDLHDIGKNLVKMMMEGKGLEVIDLGTDVPAETFVQTAIEQNCQVICCSALLTTTMDVMAEVVKAAEAAGVRDQVKIMVGGAPVNEAFAAKIGADCYTSDAASAADAAVELCK
ncbi:MAG: helix-turn-helix domain-containing protein [Clostridia bacterium]|nr:helix-turn-helix domain-containing protein [Clostridia bacterium]